MAIEYGLTLAGDTTAEQVAVRALPVPVQRPPEIAPVLSADLRESHGFTVTLLATKHGYVEAESDDGLFEWEPESYVAVGFRIDKDADREWAIVNMLTIVWRVLATGDEDASLVLNGDLLVLSRLGGVLVKHHRDDWWASYPASNAVFPD
ncbi:SitI3 family protein [Actinoplanes sp. NPDC051411]|uniref:SitI3 family protein n=1 Tax=Actinoplanes sp. NPDC051411 TaxID=3155522 RepID=UPI0034452568